MAFWWLNFSRDDPALGNTRPESLPKISGCNPALPPSSRATQHPRQPKGCDPLTWMSRLGLTMFQHVSTLHDLPWTYWVIQGFEVVGHGSKEPPSSSILFSTHCVQNVSSCGDTLVMPLLQAYSQPPSRPHSPSPVGFTSVWTFGHHPCHLRKLIIFKSDLFIWPILHHTNLYPIKSCKMMLFNKYSCAIHMPSSTFQQNLLKSPPSLEPCQRVVGQIARWRFPRSSSSLGEAVLPPGVVMENLKW